LRAELPTLPQATPHPSRPRDQHNREASILGRYPADRPLPYPPSRCMKHHVLLSHERLHTCHLSTPSNLPAALRSPFPTNAKRSSRRCIGTENHLNSSSPPLFLVRTGVTPYSPYFSFPVRLCQRFRPFSVSANTATSVSVILAS